MDCFQELLQFKSFSFKHYNQAVTLEDQWIEIPINEEFLCQGQKPKIHDKVTLYWKQTLIHYGWFWL